MSAWSTVDTLLTTDAAIKSRVKMKLRRKSHQSYEEPSEDSEDSEAATVKSYENVCGVCEDEESFFQTDDVETTYDWIECSRLVSGIIIKSKQRNLILLIYPAALSGSIKIVLVLRKQERKKSKTLSLFAICAVVRKSLVLLLKLMRQKSERLLALLSVTSAKWDFTPGVCSTSTTVWFITNLNSDHYLVPTNPSAHIAQNLSNHPFTYWPI